MKIMKYLKLFVLALFAAVGFSACMPDSPEMEAADIAAEELVMGEAYSITQDSEDPNTIYLKSLLPASYTPLWEHPQGRSQSPEVTLKIAFKGEYIIKFGVMTRGGVVYGDPYTLTLTTDNLAYVDDPMWNMLTGGPGQSKSWKLDLDADGKCKYFLGPLYFYGTDDWYGNVNGGQEATDYNGDGAIDSWNWQADWASNGSWLLGGTGAMDYGTMTFDLIDGAHLTVEDLAAGTTSTGTFLLDTENYMLTTSDAFMLHDPGRDAIVTKWGEARVLLLTEDLLQLGVIRDNDPSEGPCLLVYNYVRDGYTPPAVEEPEGPTEPVLPEGWMDTVGEITQTSIKWTLSTETPMNWHSVAGVPLNEFNSAADYPDWLGTPDPTVYEGFSLTMDSADNSYTAVAPDGTEVSGTYTLDEKGIYTFDQPLPSFAVISWATFATDADNQLRILEIGTKNGVISDMWVGAKALNEDGSLKEYMSYHLVANVGSSSSEGEPEVTGYETSIYFTNSSWWPSGNGEAISVAEDGTYTCKFNVGAGATDVMVFTVDMKGLRTDYPNASALVKEIRADGVAVDFDPAKIAYGDLEGNGNLRIEIANTWGVTAGNYAVAETMSFTTELEVDFELMLNAYEAQVMLTNDGWWPGYSGVTQTGILGVGKHKIVADVSANGAITVPMIFCLDLLSFPSAATATAAIHSMKGIDSEGNDVPLTIKPENLNYGDLEQNGNLRWEFFNIYGTTGNGVSSAPYDYSAAVIDGADFAAGTIAQLEMVVSIDSLE